MFIISLMMLRALVILGVSAASIVSVGGTSVAPVEPSLTRLKPKLDRIASSFEGRLGYSLTMLDTGATIGYRQVERFPSASTIKTSVMVEAMHQVDEGKLKWSDKMAVPTDPSRREASMWSFFLKDGTVIDLDAYVNLMIGVSDNTATIVTRDWLGTMNVNARMEALGLPNTKILGNAPRDRTDLQRLRRMFGMGMTTPRESARLFELIATNKAGSLAACEKMIRILGRQYWDDYIGSSVPPRYKVASKSGAINRSRSDVALVFGPRTYVLAIFTDNQKDRRWSVENAGERAIQKIAAEVWKGLFPNEPYRMPVGSDKFAPTGGGVE